MHHTRGILLFSLILLMVVVIGLIPGNNGEGDNNHIWKQSYTGGGGYITGFVQDPVNPEIFFARCDVAGVFKSTDGGKNWIAKNNGMTRWHHHSVQSVCISPHNSEVVFRGSGDARAHHTFGTIHKSVDGGKTWFPVTDEIDFYGNGPTRMYGETIAVNPTDSSNVIAGGYSNGIFVSDDVGESWNYKGLKHERIGIVTFHPFLENVVFAGTISDLGLYAARECENLNDFLFMHHDYPRGNYGKLFVSRNNGKNWELLFKEEGFDIAEIKFYRSNPEKITVLSPYKGLFTSFNFGRTFEKIGQDLPPVNIFGSFDIHPEMEEVLIVALRTPDLIEDKFPVPVFKSSNGGQSFHPVYDISKFELREYPGYIRVPQMAGWAISNLMFDKFEPSRIYFSNWYGFSHSDDGGTTWSGNTFSGLETNCLEHIEADRTAPGSVYYTVADHSPVFSKDGGESYHHLPKPPLYNASSAFVKSVVDTNIIIYGGVNRKSKISALVKIINHRDVKVIKSFPKGTFVQSIVEDPYREGGFYALVEGAFSDGAGLYNSIDFGDSWSKLNVDYPEKINQLPDKHYFVDAELLPIAVYQVKNVCGSDQLLAMDPFIPDRIYLGERSEGLFISPDAGKSWQRVFDQLPFGNDTASVLNVVKTDPLKKGRIFVGFVKDGLWRSDNYGVTWYKIFPKEKDFNVSSITFNSFVTDEIYISGEPLYWSEGNSDLLVSYDGGKKWKSIYNTQLGALRVKGIDYDSDLKRIYVATSGNGAFFVQKVKNKQVSFLGWLRQ